MLSYIWGTFIDKIIGDSIKSESKWGWIIAGLISALLFVITIIMIMNDNLLVAILFFILGVIPIYVRIFHLYRAKANKKGELLVE